jgi:hypothetical protein
MDCGYSPHSIRTAGGREVAMSLLEPIAITLRRPIVSLLFLLLRRCSCFWDRSGLQSGPLERRKFGTLQLAENTSVLGYITENRRLNHTRSTHLCFIPVAAAEERCPQGCFFRSLFSPWDIFSVPVPQRQNLPTISSWAASEAEPIVRSDLPWGRSARFGGGPPDCYT